MPWLAHQLFCYLNVSIYRISHPSGKKQITNASLLSTERGGEGTDWGSLENQRVFIRQVTTWQVTNELLYSEFGRSQLCGHVY